MQCSSAGYGLLFHCAVRCPIEPPPSSPPVRQPLIRPGEWPSCFRGLWLEFTEHPPSRPAHSPLLGPPLRSSDVINCLSVREDNWILVRIICVSQKAKSLEPLKHIDQIAISISISITNIKKKKKKAERVTSALATGDKPARSAHCTPSSLIHSRC